ncbi:hypothetical protein [Pseudoalteromonas sp. SMS1]|uniref:hypothetical protein n=1 Tax=Pseudoalteromonas sp. SMS1 TaxID=2908894 RepID=UPI003FA7CC0F
MIERLKLLSDVFAIENSAYDIMSNHCHLVVKVNQQHALNWTNERWQGYLLFKMCLSYYVFLKLFVKLGKLVSY